MARYRVKAGRHVEGGRVYNKGDIVVSDAPLTKLFKEKFTVLGEASVPSKPAPASGGGEEQPAKAAAKPAAKSTKPKSWAKKTETKSDEGE